MCEKITYQLKCLLRYVIGIILLSASIIALSQEDNLRFNYLTTTNGLSNNNITCITQDKMGFIWIGTSDGLNRYNGFDIKVFKHDLIDSSSLADNMIFSIFIDHVGNIWVGTQNGLCLYDPDKENFKSFVLNRTDYHISTTNKITGIAEDSKNNLFVTSEAGFIYKFNQRESSFILASPFLKNIKTLIIDKNDDFWVGGIKSVYYFNPRTNKTISFNLNFSNSGDKVNIINTISEEGDSIWFGTNDGKLYYVSKNHLQMSLAKRQLDDIYFIYQIYTGKNGITYYSTDMGLVIFNAKNQSYTKYVYQPNDIKGLNSKGTTCIFVDRQKNLWVGTRQGGINIAQQGKSFANYNLFSRNVSLDISNILSFCEDNDGNIWLGSFDFGVNIINFTTRQKKFLNSETKNPNSLGYGSIYCIYQDSKNNIWIGSYLGFLQKYNPNLNNFKSYPFFPENGNASEGKDIRSIIEDNQGNLWLGAEGFGISKFNPKTEKYKHFQREKDKPNSSLADNYPFKLLYDNQHFIWVATPSGLSKFDPVKETFVNYYHNLNDLSSLCNNFVNTIFEDSYKNLWIGTSYGLDLFDKTNNSFIHFYEKDGLPSNLIKSIEESKPGELWISTGNGLSKMNFTTGKVSKKITASFKTYDKSDNLQDNLFWERSSLKLKNGSLAFGSENGIVMFNPENINENITPPDVYITSFKLFNKEVAIGEYDSLLKHNIIQTKEIVINRTQNFITFKFIAINYISSEKNQYAYKLEGFDKDWINIGNNNEASYTNLDPGDYTFLVKACNNDNYWNEKGISIKLTVLPPFWKTWWFKSIVILIFILLVLGFYLFRYRLILKQNSLLESRVTERTSALTTANNDLIERNKWILSQNQEISNQNQEIYYKNEEINSQKELLLEQKNKIEAAYEELSKYRTQLEDIVDERTKELIFAKEKAEESDKLKSSFLANLSHEIRTPLNAIIGFSGMLAEEDLTVQDKDKFNTIIKHSSDMLLSLINDVIDISKIEAGRLSVHKTELPMKKIASQVFEIFNFEMRKQQIGFGSKLNFKVNIPEKDIELILFTDEIRLMQIISNLINNAIKFTPFGIIEFGTIERTEEKSIEFYIKDTGIGIKAEYLSIIFQRFRKVEDNDNQIYRGAGLGLAISSELVHLLGGAISVVSKPNEGSVFSFNIPLKMGIEIRHEIHNQKINSSFPHYQGIKILIAEDDYSNYLYLEKLLRKTGATVIHATNGENAVTLISSHPDCKVILMDIKMPVMDGIQAFKLIRELGNSTPIVAQTAHALADEVIKFKDIGFDYYITKPIKAADIFNILNKILLDFD